MPLNLPDKLPAIDILKEENIFVIDNSRASTQDIRPLKIVILNLMPIKITTETDLIRLLSNSPLQIEVSFMKLKSHTSKNTPIEHMKAFYRDFECMRNEKFDGMIITGAPVEHLEFEDVSYWDEIQDIFNWTRTHVTSTLYICWAAQAGLYHHYGIPKYPLDKKMFGIFEHHICEGMSKLPIFRGFDDVFFVPHSRHTEVRRADIDTEYRRDLGKGLPIDMPKNYYRDNDPEKGPLVRWRSTANLLFSNWLNYYVYQETPYDINQIK